jgi:hypothetical protein
VPLHKDELDKENITDSSSQRLSSASKSTASSVSDSVFLQARMSTSSTKKRRRSSNEPTIDEVTQLSSDAMRLNLTSTEGTRVTRHRHTVWTTPLHAPDLRPACRLFCCPQIFSQSTAAHRYASPEAFIFRAYRSSTQH